MMRFLKVLAAVLFAVLQSSESAWINEFHYDNSGTDSGEFIEIAYASTESIGGYTVVLYNGNGGSSYNTVSVPVGSHVSGGVYVSVIDYPTNGIQNGAPDGIALVDASNSVVEFLSYEGTLTASGGPANGMISTNIGVSETSSTPVGFSLQRSGSGCAGTDFSWANAALQTKGSANNGQTFTCGGGGGGGGGPTTTVPTTPASNSCSTVVPPAQGVKIMTYNILQGGTSGSRWKDVVKAENADIVVFTEVGNWDDNNDELLNQNLNEFNAFFSTETPYCGSTVQGIGFANSANAIMTRFPIVQEWQLTDTILSSDSAHDLMVWKLDVGSGNFLFVIGIHLKCCGGSTNDSRRNNTMKNLIAWIDANTSAMDGVILMGDFNAVSPYDTGDFAPSSGSTLNSEPLAKLLDSSNSDSSIKHTFIDVFREANPTCNVFNCCADSLCDGGLSGTCDERGYTYVGSSHNYDSRIDFIIANQHVTVAGPATAGDLTGSNVCSASDHLSVDAIVDFFGSVTPTTTVAATTTATTPPPPSSWTILFFNDFETGWENFNDGGGDAARRSDIAHSGSYALRVRDNSGSSSSVTSDPVGVSTYQDVRVRFWYYPISMENNEDFFLEYSEDGGSFLQLGRWVRGTDFINGIWYSEEIIFTLPCGITSIEIRFRCDASNNYDRIYIDEVEVAAK